MSRLMFITVMLTALIAAPQASAGLLFHFTEEGEDVKMTASGSIDTSGLVASVDCNPGCEWFGTGFFDLGGSYLMGRHHIPTNEASFGFNTGTDLSPWQAGGPFTLNSTSHFSVYEDDGKTFSTVSVTEGGAAWDIGLAVNADDLADDIWKTSQSWLAEDHTFETLGLIEGIYTITDAVSGESMTIQVGVSVPEPATLGLLSIGLMGLAGIRRRRQAA